MTTTIAQTLLQPAKPNYIELYQLDLTSIGGSIIYLTPNTIAGAAPSFGGQVYTPIPIQTDSWEVTNVGASPQPTVKISNVTKLLQSYLTTYQDFVGARLTRLLTFDIYLDTGSEPDATQVFRTQTFIVSQKTKQSAMELTFKLVSPLDAPQARIPRQVVTRALFPGAGLFQSTGG